MIGDFNNISDERDKTNIIQVTDRFHINALVKTNNLTDNYIHKYPTKLENTHTHLWEILN